MYRKPRVDLKTRVADKIMSMRAVVLATLSSARANDTVKIMARQLDELVDAIAVQDNAANTAQQMAKVATGRRNQHLTDADRLIRTIRDAGFVEFRDHPNEIASWGFEIFVGENVSEQDVILAASPIANVAGVSGFGPTSDQVSFSPGVNGNAPRSCELSDGSTIMSNPDWFPGAPLPENVVTDSDIECYTHTAVRLDGLNEYQPTNNNYDSVLQSISKSGCVIQTTSGFDISLSCIIDQFGTASEEYQQASQNAMDGSGWPMDGSPPGYEIPLVTGTAPLDKATAFNNIKNSDCVDDGIVHTTCVLETYGPSSTEFLLVEDAFGEAPPTGSTIEIFKLDPSLSDIDIAFLNVALSGCVMQADQALVIDVDCVENKFGVGSTELTLSKINNDWNDWEADLRPEGSDDIQAVINSGPIVPIQVTLLLDPVFDPSRWSGGFASDDKLTLPGGSNKFASYTGRTLAEAGFLNGDAVTIDYTIEASSPDSRAGLSTGQGGIALSSLIATVGSHSVQAVVTDAEKSIQIYNRGAGGETDAIVFTSFQVTKTDTETSV